MGIRYLMHSSEERDVSGRIVRTRYAVLDITGRPVQT